MKKIVLLPTMTLLLNSLPARAGQEVTALDVYNEWKTKVSATSTDGSLSGYYCLASVVKRTNKKNAELDFIVAGNNMSRIRLLIQPLRLQRQPDGRETQEPAGELTESLVGVKPTGKLPELSPLTVTIPASAEASAFEVKWQAAAEKPLSVTVILPLAQQPTSNVTSLFRK